jgi:DNA-directed RNA polymerase sigma subunit (sigma70/sigma32)
MSKIDLSQIEDGSIDAGLFVLSVLFPEGCPYSQEQIAFICGCSRSNIWQYEKNGLRKIKAKFKSKGLADANLLV